MWSLSTATMRFDGDIDAPFRHLLAVAEREIAAARAELPAEIRAGLERVALVLEEFPSPEHLASGVEADQLGLFDGPDARDAGSPFVPTITIWLGNLWEMCGADEADYREEVRVTFLHEIGHYIGFGEADLGDRGLL
jgi:predicted Zn-dependent protease with MMP-like domain